MVMISVHLPSVGEEGYALKISIYRFSQGDLSYLGHCQNSAKNGHLGDFVTGKLLLPVNSEVVKLLIPQNWNDRLCNMGLDAR
jgi:hypothetical protein